MSLFFAARGEQRSSVWADYADAPRGRAVTQDNAPRLAPVFAAHRHIVDYVSTLPVDSYRKDADRRVEISLPPLLANTEAPGAPGVIAWLGQAAYGLAGGNAVGWVSETDGYGYPTRVTWLHWSQWSFDERTKQWFVTGQPVPWERIVHIPWIVPPGKTLGMSPIEHYASIVRAGMAAQDYGDVSTNFPPVVFRNTKKTLAPGQSSAIRARLASSMRKREPLVTGADWDFKTVTIPPNQTQFVETQKLTANQVAAIYGIDPTEIGGTAANSLTYSTEEMRQINRAANMRPYLTRIERGIARILPMKQFIKLNVDATLRTDVKTRREVQEIERRIGLRSINEQRALEDLPGIGPAGDVYVPATQQPAATREGDPS